MGIFLLSNLLYVMPIFFIFFSFVFIKNHKDNHSKDYLVFGIINIILSILYLIMTTCTIVLHFLRQLPPFLDYCWFLLFLLFPIFIIIDFLYKPIRELISFIVEKDCDKKKKKRKKLIIWSASSVLFIAFIISLYLNWFYVSMGV